MKMKICLLAALLVTTSGCATLISGMSQKVKVQVIDAETQVIIPDAICVVTDGDGLKHTMKKNPEKVVLSKNFTPLALRCKAQGYEQKDVGQGARFDKVGLVNLIYWPGFTIDGVTGAMKKYPTEITVEMDKV